MGLGGVILAAGESTRMGRDKALLPWPPDSSQGSAAGPPARSGTLLSSAIDTFTQFCDMVIVVAGKNEAALAPVVYSRGASLSCNRNPERGQFSSLQTGLREVMNQGRDAAIITLVDRPPARSETIQKLLDAFATRNHNLWAIVPQFQVKHGHPFLIGIEMIDLFLKAPATSNARDIEHANQSRIEYVQVDDPLVTMNINTPEDYASLKSNFGVATTKPTR